MNVVDSAIYRLLKKSQVIYFTRMRLLDRDYKAAKEKMKFALKSPEQIEDEMKLVKKYWKCEPLHYIRYELFNKRLSQEEILDFVPPYFHYNFYANQFYRNIDKDLYRNKYKLFWLFKQRNIPTPEVLARYYKGSLYNLQNEQIDLDDVLHQLSAGDKLFFKPTTGQGGTGIIVMHFLNGILHYHQCPLTKEAIYQVLKDKEYVLQKGLIQRDDISSINSSSVNTLRVVTQWRNATPVIAVVVMRIGRDGKEVDNSHQGGISVRVDVNNGRLFREASAEHGGGHYVCHPDSKVVFENFQIKDWKQIKEKLISYVKMFPELEEIAWDVAITTDGIKIIEINLGYGLSHLQCCCGGMRRILNIYPVE